MYEDDTNYYTYLPLTIMPAYNRYTVGSEDYPIHFSSDASTVFNYMVGGSSIFEGTGQYLDFYGVLG